MIHDNRVFLQFRTLCKSLLRRLSLSRAENDALEGRRHISLVLGSLEPKILEKGWSLTHSNWLEEKCAWLNAQGMGVDGQEFF